MNNSFNCPMCKKEHKYVKTDNTVQIVNCECGYSFNVMVEREKIIKIIDGLEYHRYDYKFFIYPIRSCVNCGCPLSTQQTICPECDLYNFLDNVISFNHMNLYYTINYIVIIEYDQYICEIYMDGYLIKRLSVTSTDFENSKYMYVVTHFVNNVIKDVKDNVIVKTRGGFIKYEKDGSISVFSDYYNN